MRSSVHSTKALGSSLRFAAAGLARPDKINAPFFERIRDDFELCAFSGAVNTFNRNKFPTFCHLKSLTPEILLNGRIMLFECLGEFGLAALAHGHKV